MTVAIPSARYIALGSWRDGLARSFAVNVMMPKPRKAKKVSATLEMMSFSGGYPEGASSDGFMLTSVTIVDQRDDREQGEDPQHDVDDHGLRARDELGPDDVHAGHHDDDQRRKNLRPHLVLAGDRGAGVAAERDRHHRRHDGVHKVDQPRGGPGEMTVAEPLGDVLQQAAGARIPRAELGEGVALQDGDRPGN